MKRRIPPIVFVSVLLVSLVLSLIPIQKAAAISFNQPPPPGTIAYTSGNTIHVKTTFTANDPKNLAVTFNFDSDFVDGQIWDSTIQYDNNQNGCDSHIMASSYGAVKALVDFSAPDPYLANTCAHYYTTIPNIGNPDAGRTLFNWTSANQITGIQDNILLGQDVSNPLLFKATVNKDLVGGSCPSFSVNCTVSCDVTLTLQADNKNANGKIGCSQSQGQCLDPTGCGSNRTLSNILVGASPTAPFVPPSPTTGPGTVGTKVNCTWSLNPLTWFLCPVLDLVQGIMNQVQQWIFNFLQTPNVYFQPTSGNPTAKALYTAWGSLRGIALAILGIIALIMVLSQAFSFGPFDAYTVKKLLPRMLVAAIMISLSWAIVGLMVAISNALGDGIRTLIYAPFNDPAFSAPSFSGGTLTGGAVGLFGVGTALGILGILSFGLTAAISLLVGFFVIILRQIFVLFLAILAPVAIVLFILPGTKKAWDLWWDSFSGVLLMFPIITGFIAIGSAFAKIAVSGSTSTVNQVVAFVAIYAPYFLLPVAVRLAGGAISTIGGAVHQRGKGIHGLIGGYRKNQAAKNMHALKTGDRWHGQSWIPGSEKLATRAGRITSGAATGWQGHFGLGARGKARVGGVAQANADSWLKDHPEAQKVLVAQDDTTAVLGLSRGTSSGAARAASMLQSHWQESLMAGGMDANSAQTEASRRASAALESARALGVTRSSAMAALGVMGQNKSRSIGAGEYEMIQQGIHGLADGNTGLERDLAYNFQYNSRQAGRQDLGGDWMNEGVASAQRAGDVQGARRAVLMNAVKRADTRAVVAGHSATTRQAADVVRDDFRSGDQVRMMESAALISELHGNLASATGENRDNITQMISDLGIDMNDSSRGNLEQQLVARINAGVADPRAQVTTEGLRNFSRTWGSGSAPITERGGAPPPPNGGAGPAGGPPGGAP